MHLLLFYFVVVTCFLQVSCNSARSSNLVLTPNVDSTVVLFDIKDYSRGELATFINKIDSLQPAVIAMNVVFVGFKKAHDDSLLTEAIANSGKVILAAGVKEGRVLRPEYFLEDRALAVGVTKFVADDKDRISQFIGLYQDDDGKQDMSLGMAVHFYFTVPAGPTKERMGDKLPDFGLDDPWPIVYSKKTSQFKVLDETNLTLGDVKGKVVLFGDLAPHKDDPITVLGTVEGENERTNTTIILANIIVDLIKKYH